MPRFFCLAKTASAIKSRGHQLLPRDDVAAVLGPRLGSGRGWGEARGRAQPGGVQAPLLGLGVAEPAPARQLFRTDVSFPRERAEGSRERSPVFCPEHGAASCSSELHPVQRQHRCGGAVLRLVVAHWARDVPTPRETADSSGDAIRSGKGFREHSQSQHKTRSSTTDVWRQTTAADQMLPSVRVRSHLLKLTKSGMPG